MSTYKLKTRITIDLVRRLIVGLIILLFGFYFWRHFGGNPIHEFRLLTNGKIANGYVINAEETSEYIEKNDGRTGEMEYEFHYKYYFVLPDGKRIDDEVTAAGKLPKDLCCLKDGPYEVKVEYLSSNPTINRVKNYDAGSKTVGEFLWRKVALGGILLIGALSFGIFIIKYAVNEYKKEIRIYKSEYLKWRNQLSK